MRRTLSNMLLLACLLLPVAATAQPVEVASGHDLVAWQKLEHRRLAGAEAAQAYRTYVLEFHASPLAVVAWDRLVALGADRVEAPEPPSQRRLVSVRARWQAHQATLLADDVGVEVAAIDLSEPDDDAAAVLRDTGLE